MNILLGGHWINIPDGEKDDRIKLVTDDINLMLKALMLMKEKEGNTLRHIDKLIMVLQEEINKRK